MYKWCKQFATEWLLLRRRWWLLLAVPLFGVWMLYDMTTASVWEAPNVYTRVYAFSYFGQTMTLGLAIMLGMLTIRRDTVPRRAELLETWSLGNATWLTAKFVALFFYLSLYSLVMVGVMSISYIRQGVTLMETWDHIVFMFMQYELSYAVTLALGMALATWIRHRVVYLIGFCAWMFGTFFIELVLIERQHLYFLKTFHLSQFLRSALWRSDVWGFDIVSDELLRSRLFVVLFTVCLLAAMVVTRYRRRPGQGRAFVLGSLPVFAVGLVATGVWYGQVWQERIGHYRAEAAHYTDYMDEQAYNDDKVVAPDEIIPFQVEAYDLEVRQTGEHAITVHATLTLDPAQVGDASHVTFTLNHAFAIKQVHVNDKQVDFERNWDTLVLNRGDFPQGEQKWTLKIDYAGDVFHYGMMPEHVSDFVSGDHVFLPYYTAWYPLPGEQELYLSEGGRKLLSRRETIVAGQSDMKLSLIGFSGKVYATLASSGGKQGAQTYSGASEHGVTLIAGDFVEVTYEDVQLITSAVNRLEGEQFLQDWHDKVMAYYDDWLFRDGQRKVLRTIYHLPDVVGEGWPINLNTESILNESLFLKENKYIRLTAITNRSKMLYFNAIQGVMNAYLFDDADMFSLVDDNVTAAVRTAYLYLYVREVFQESHEQAIYLVGDKFGEADDGEMSPEQHVLEMVGHAVNSGEISKVKDMLRHLYPVVSQYDLHTYLDQPDEGVTWHEWQRLWKEYGLSE